MIRLFAAVTLLTGMTGAQMVPQAIDGAVVGVLLEEPRVVDEGVMLRASGQLRVVRVLAGDLRENDLLALAWEYRASPNEPREPEKRMPGGPGLWLLTQEDGAWRPQPFLPDRSTVFAGGVTFPLPGEALPPQYWPPAGADWERAVAHEIRWALEALAQKHGAQLNPQRRVLRTGAVATATTPPQRLFMVAARLLWSLPEDQTREVYRGLSGSPYPNARMAGLTGLLRAEEHGVAQEVERDWAMLAPTIEAGHLPSAATALRRLPREDWLALARLAISETAPPFLEQRIATHLGNVGEAALPFLAVFLEHPDAAVRSSALSTVCYLLRTTVDEEQQWCPRQLPITDAAREREVSGFWLARLHEMGAATQRAPARYGSIAPTGPPEEAPVEDRLFGLAIAFTRSRIPHPLRTALDERDQQTLHDILTKLWNDEQERQAAHLRRIHEQRRQGLPFDRAAGGALGQARYAGRTAALEQLRQQLSPAGWRAVEEQLREMRVLRQRVPVNP